MRRNISSFTVLIQLTGSLCLAQAPSISSLGIVPVYSPPRSIMAGEWASIYGSNLATGTAVWNGDFPTSLGGTAVKLDGKLAYLWYVSPGQINFQVPDDTTIGPVSVVVTTATGSATSTAILSQYAPSFSLLDEKHVAGIILRSDGSGAYAGGTFDILGPGGNSLGYPTQAARPGDNVELFGVGFGPTTPAAQAGRSFSGAAATNSPVAVLINYVSVAPSFAGLSSAGLYQLDLTIPSGIGSGDVSIQATTGGALTQPGVEISLQTVPVGTSPVKYLTLSSAKVAGGATVMGTVVLSVPAPSNGAAILLSSTIPKVASVPLSATVPEGASSISFTIATAQVTTNQTVVITASYAGGSQQTNLSITPGAMSNRTFAAWGDSLTYGDEELDGVTYPGLLATLLGASVYNGGQDGATSQQILSNFQAQPSLLDRIDIFWETRNNLFTDGVSVIIGNINSQIAALTSNPKQYLVLSLMNNEGEPKGSGAYQTVLSANSALSSAYPSNYLDIRSAIVVGYNSYIPADALDSSNDIMPQSLRAHYLGGALSENITPTTTSFSIAGVRSAGNSVQPNSILQIDGEFIYVLSVSGTDPGPWTITSATRGYGSTTAASHASGIPLQVIDPAHLDVGGWALVANQVYTWLAAKGWQ